LLIVTDSGPLTLRLERDDGMLRDDFLPIPEGGGGAMAALPAGGTYSLLIDAPGRWGVTIVSQPTEGYAQSAGVGPPVVGGASPAVSFELQMPEVEHLPDPGRLFACARRLAAKLKQLFAGDMPGSTAFRVMLPAGAWFWGRRALVVVTPGKMLLAYPVGTRESMTQESNERIESILPSNPPRNIAAICYNALTALMVDPDRCIPFRGFLLHFAVLGHTVWVFEGHRSRLEAGFRDADILLIDSGMIPHLPPEWQEIAGRVMRGRELWIHDRKRYALFKTKVGKVRIIIIEGEALFKFDEPPIVLGGGGPS